MPFTPEQIDEIFTYHPPDSEQIGKYQRLRDAAKEFAHVLVEETPSCPSQTIAVRKLSECVMVANQSIALKGSW